MTALRGRVVTPDAVLPDAVVEIERRPDRGRA